jgi:hypothetical protein
MSVRIALVVLGLLISSCQEGAPAAPDAGGEAGADGTGGTTDAPDVDVRVRDVCAGPAPTCSAACGGPVQAAARCVGDRWSCPPGLVNPAECACLGLACFPRPDGGAAGHSGGDGGRDGRSGGPFNRPDGAGGTSG